MVIVMGMVMDMVMVTTMPIKDGTSEISLPWWRWLSG